MSVWEESGIRFDFSGAAHSEKHDEENRKFPAVDFLVHETPGNWLYVEVKNWEPASLPAHAQAESRADFAAKMRSAVFYQELRNKFLGTSAFFDADEKAAADRAGRVRSGFGVPTSDKRVSFPCDNKDAWTTAKPTEQRHRMGGFV